MANSSQARKRARQNITRNLRNRSYRSSIRTSTKSLLKAIQTGDKEGISTAYQATTSAIDKGASRGLMHKNNAARLKSRLNKRVQAVVS